MAALIAIPVLGEVPDTAAIIGIAATSIGVALASGAIAMRRSTAA
jgi:drug/metabolite transporter (DMT)-like permease